MIAVGDKLPQMELQHMTADGPTAVSTDDLFSGKTIVLFAVPGAFTPTCSNAHLPGYIQSADKLRDKGIDNIICLSVNDPFVMGAWGEQQNAADKVMMLADGSGNFTKAIGMELDVSGVGLGIRSQRYSMLVRDGVVASLNLETDPTKAIISGAENMLDQQ